MQAGRVAHLESGASTEIVAGFTVDECTVMFLCSLHLLVMWARMGTEVSQTGEVPVSYYSIWNTSTFPFWGNTAISVHSGNTHT